MGHSLLTWKVSVLLALGVGKFIIGVIPAYYIKRNNNGKKKIIISGLLCFGTGVILFQSPFLEHHLDIISYVISVGGFFLLYLANEIYDYRRKSSSSKQSDHIYLPPHVRADEILPENPGLERNVSNAPSSFTKKDKVHQNNALSAAPGQHRHEEKSCVSHKKPVQPNSNSYASHFGLSLALIFVAGYNALQMGAVGNIKELRQKMLYIFITQSISAFWLGLELSEAYGCGRILIFSILLYSGASALGIGIGILGVDTRTQVLPILIHFAKGMILYVVLLQILPREGTRWHNSQMRLARLVLFSLAFCGCIFMAIMYHYIYYTN